MKRFLLTSGIAITLAAVWVALVLIGFIEGWGRRPLAEPGDAQAFVHGAVEFIESRRPGNVAFILLESGGPMGQHYASIGSPVDGDTRFQVASLSKWISAWGVMALVDAGKIDLDAPVNSYLTRWQLPPSEFDNDQVTVRRLLSHTAGLTDGLGYAGFAEGEEPQALEASLTVARDASPGADGRVLVGLVPGSTWEYSGGGYTLLQLLVEEVSGRGFDEYMRQVVFEPLGMYRSAYVLGEEESDNLAASYDRAGRETPLLRFTSQAATSLYTTANDLARFLQAQRPGPDGSPAGCGVLQPSTLELMRTPHAAQMGADIWGLGLMLFAPNNGGDFIIGHDGSNEPAINTTARVDPATGDGIVLLETGHPHLATQLAGEWVFWHTGNVDFLTVTMEVGRMIRVVLIGMAVILVLSVVVGSRGRRSAHRAAAAIATSE